MSFERTPAGTYGGRASARAGRIDQVFRRLMLALHRRSGNRFMGMDLLYLSTVGAKTGRRRVTPLTRFPDSDNSWLIVASLAGSAEHPSWYHNIAANPDQVWIQIGDRRTRVRAEQLCGVERERTWQRITSSQPRYKRYQQKTDRVLPIIRLISADGIDLRS